MAIDCCNFWMMKKGVKTSPCASCESTNQTFGTSFAFDSTGWVACANIWIDSLCNAGWYHSPYLDNCDGDTALEVYFTPTIDSVLIRSRYDGGNPADETDLVEDFRVNIVANTSSSDVGVNSNIATYYKLVPGTLSGEDIIESGEIGEVEVDVFYNQAG